MPHFAEAMHPDDLDERHKGDELILDEPIDEPEEGERDGRPRSPSAYVRLRGVVGLFQARLLRD